jgi:hypothetical protein
MDGLQAAEPIPLALLSSFQGGIDGLGRTSLAVFQMEERTDEVEEDLAQEEIVAAARKMVVSISHS